MTQQLQLWALPRLSSLLPLDEDSLKQIITYTDTLPKQAASEHLKNLLGDSPQALEFIASFNTRRPTPPSEAVSNGLAAPTRNTPGSSVAPSQEGSESESGVPRPKPKQNKRKQPYNKLPEARRPDNFGDVTGGYKKKDQQDDYMASRRKEPVLSNTLSLDPTPSALQVPSTTATAISSSAEISPAASPYPVATPTSSAGPSRTSSPAPSSTSKSKSKQQPTTIKFTANSKTMHAPSTSLSDLDAAIRTLESTTNPKLPANSTSATKARACNCQAQRHALLTAAPNCLNCGKIICVKEGMGPCTYCGVPLLKPTDVQEMLRTLREERGRERTNVHNQAHSKLDVSQKPRPFSKPASAASSSNSTSSDVDEEKLNAARMHKNRLLNYQSENAARTTIHDEAADFATPDTGTSIWATPTQRALQLKKQQKLLKEQQWNAKQEYEKRRVVVSLDATTGKAVRRMEAVDMPDFHDEEVNGENRYDTPPEISRQKDEDGDGPSGFAKNPFMGQLIRPVYNANPQADTSSDAKGKSRATPQEPQAQQRVRGGWRANTIVQSDKDDNEDIILDGGAYGDRIDGRVLAAEEPACG